VEVFNNKSWKRGTVVMLNYNGWLWPPEWTAPYQIKLEGSPVLVYVPEDSDILIRGHSLNWVTPCILERTVAIQMRRRAERKRRDNLKRTKNKVHGGPCR